MSTIAQVQFLGGAGTVTGSKFLIEQSDYKILVDCGMFQGLKNLRLMNWNEFPVDPSQINAVLLTHAHLDHCGYLPLLVKNGFKGNIYCSEPTRALAEIILRDSAHLQQEDAERANEGGYSKHKPALPLYTTKDVEKTLPLFRVQPLHQWINLHKNIDFRLRLSGHILGSTFVELDWNGKRIVFSGDLGRTNPMNFNPPDRLDRADYLLIESTYGDRKHPKESALDQFEKVIHETISRGGQVLVPSFAVGRAQEILYLIYQLRKAKRLPDVPVYLDSPMAIQTTSLYGHYPDWHSLNSEEVAGLQDQVSLVCEALRSRELQRDQSPAIIIAGSGMFSGGRILSHAVQKLPNPKHSFVLVGYQAAGTVGRFLKEGADEVKIFGQYIPVKAQIKEITTLSAHADQSEIIHWLKGFSLPPQKTFVIHGEPHSANALRVRIKDELNWQVFVPELNEKVRLD